MSGISNPIPAGGGGGGGGGATEALGGAARVINSLGIGPVIHGNWGSINPDASSSNTNAAGIFDGNFTNVDSSSTSVKDNSGLGLKQNTSSSINNDAYTQGMNNLIQHKSNVTLLITFKLEQTTDCRFSAGFFNTSAVTINDEDDKSINGYVLKYSSARPDANFLFSTGSSPVNIDTGVPVDTNVHTLLIDHDNLNDLTQFWLFDADGVLEANEISSETIGGGTAARPAIGIQNLAGAIKGFTLYHMQLWIKGRA